MCYTYLSLTWIWIKLVEPTCIGITSVYLRIWGNSRNGEELILRLIFNHWINVFVAFIAEEGSFEDNRPLVVANYDLEASEFVEITSWSTFQIVFYVTRDNVKIRRLKFGKSSVIHQIHLRFLHQTFSLYTNYGESLFIFCMSPKHLCLSLLY